MDLRRMTIGGAGWTPGAPLGGSLPSLWLRADAGCCFTGAGSGAPTDGDPIQVWLSKDAGAYSFAQTTAAKKPTWTASNGDFNGRPTVTYDGVDDIMTYGAALTTETAGCLYVVFKRASIGTQHTLVSSADYTAALDLWSVRIDSTNDHEWYSLDSGINAIESSGTAVGTSAAQILMFESSGTAHRLEINGVEDALTVDAGVPAGKWFGDIANRDNVSVGGDHYNGGNTNPFHGNVAEVMLYDRVLTADELDQVDRYLANRYGLAI